MTFNGSTPSGDPVTTTESVAQRENFERRLLVASIVGPGLNFASAPLLASALGTSGRGTVAAVVSAFFILRFLATFGGQEAALTAAGWPELGIAGAARAAVRWIFPISVLVAVVSIVAAPLMFPQDAEAVSIFRVVALMIPLAAVTDGQRFAITADRRWKPIVAHIVLPRVVRFFGALVMVLAAITSPLVGVWVSVAGIALGAAVILKTVRSVPGDQNVAPDVERRFRRFAATLGPGQMARLGNRRLDQILLGAAAGSSELGIYAVAVALAEVADLPTRSIRQLAMRSSNGEDGPGFDAYFRAGLLLFIPAAIGLGLVIPVVLWLLFPPEFMAALWPAEILLVAGLANFVRDVLGAFLVNDLSARLESVIQVSTLVVGAAAVLLFGSAFGALGAAIAALVSYSFGAILVLVKYRRAHPEVGLRGLVPRGSDISVARAMVVSR